METKKRPSGLIPSFLTHENKSHLAKQAGVTWSVVHWTDLYLYDQIPPRIYRALKAMEPNTKWQDIYAAGKAQQLVAHKQAVVNSPWMHKDPDASYISWNDFREEVEESQMGFCRLFLINPAILQHYESGMTKNLPSVIKKRLLFFGMDKASIDKLYTLPIRRHVRR